MAKPIAIFYHTFVSGPGVAIEHGVSIVQEQIADLESSGLLSESAEFYVGVSGGVGNFCAVSTMMPQKARIVQHGPETCGELPTLCAMQDWLPDHRDWNVLYLHTKGALYQGNGTWAAWRHCMTNAVVHGWQQCIRDLDFGFDCVGAHWISPRQYGAIVGKYPYFGGNFYWATARHLLRLPKLSPNGPSRHEAEVWLGKTDQKIKHRDYSPHWPGPSCLRSCR